MSLHYSKSPSDPFSLRSNRCLWIHVVYPWSSPDGPWLLGPHWFLHLSWNMPSMLLPLQFVNPFLVLFFPKYHTLTLLFFFQGSAQCHLIQLQHVKWQVLLTPQPSRHALSPLACFSPKQFSPSDTYICLSIDCLLPPPLPPLQPDVKLHKSRNFVLFIVVSPEPRRVPDA